MRPLDKFQYFTLRLSQYGGVDVLGWSTYPEGSVLAGQPMKVFLTNRATEAEARSTLRQALIDQGLDEKLADCGFSNRWTEPRVSLNHLPSEDDPVPGGMYPDDVGD